MIKYFSSILVIFVLLLFSNLSYAASQLTFTWDANTEPDLAGYRIYQSASSGVYVYGVDGNAVLDIPVLDIPVGTTIGTIQVSDGIWYWIVTAYDTSGNESGPSNEVTAVLDSVPPGSPSGFTITIIIKVE